MHTIEAETKLVRFTADSLIKSLWPHAARTIGAPGTNFQAFSVAVQGGCTLGIIG